MVADYISTIAIVGMCLGVINAFLPMQKINEKIFKIKDEELIIKDLNIPMLEVDENIPFNEAQNYFDSVYILHKNSLNFILKRIMID